MMGIKRIVSKLTTALARLGAAVTLAIVLQSFAGVSATEGPFWKVTGEKGDAYLFGSVHFGIEAIYPLDADVEKAFAGADRLAVEVNLQAVDSQALMLWVARHGAFTDGSSLSENVSPATWQLLKRRADEFGVPLGAFAFQRPWLAAFSMTALALTREGFREELGIDRYFRMRASGTKTITELESIEGQLSLLAGLSPDVEEFFLQMTLEDLDSRESTFSKLFDAWKRGDADAIQTQTEEMRSGPHGDVLFRQLIEQRNENMARQVSRLIESGGTTFVVVGAAHLVGPRGLAALLSSQGYRVEKR